MNSVIKAALITFFVTVVGSTMAFLATLRPDTAEWSGSLAYGASLVCGYTALYQVLKAVILEARLDAKAEVSPRCQFYNDDDLTACIGRQA